MKDICANECIQVLGIALTDTFGTPAFLDAFRKPIRPAPVQSDASAYPPVTNEVQTGHSSSTKTYAQVYTGVRQDSGDPTYFVKMVRDFYDREGITDKKTVVFSDSLDIEHCLEYKAISEEAGFNPTFGVGTFFTSKFWPALAVHYTPRPSADRVLLTQSV